MKRRGVLGVFFFLWLASHGVAGQDPGLPENFQKANSAYREGKYSEAASLYESLVSKGQGNASVFYNLGNAYFKQNRLGKAILSYEKARRFDPRNREILANLGYVKGLLEFRIEDRRNWYLRAGETLLRSFTEPEIGIASLGLSFLFLLVWGVSLYGGNGGPWGWKRRTLFWGALFCLSLWGSKIVYDRTVQEAVVLKNQAAVRYGPSYKDRVAFRLGEGMSVQVNKTEGDWSRVMLRNRETGWMAREDLGTI
jgi:tetratricopeptide (TPR) repeat protein